MSYFTREDHMALLEAKAQLPDTEVGLQRLHRKLTTLHRTLYPHFRKQGIELHSQVIDKAEVGFSSCACPFQTELMTLSYMRSVQQAHTIEGAMGRDRNQLDTRCHPVIEIRITENAFVVELIVASEAWFDQQNLAGKLTIDTHRHSFYNILSNLDAEYLMGFWGGAQVDDMHLSSEKLPPPHVLHQWLDTFAAGRDYFRIGAWYDIEDERLSEDNIKQEIFERVRELSTIYDFISWNSNNNFHEFYKRSLAKVR